MHKETQQQELPLLRVLWSAGYQATPQALPAVCACVSSDGCQSVALHDTETMPSNFQVVTRPAIDGNVTNGGTGGKRGWHG